MVFIKFIGFLICFFLGLALYPYRMKTDINKASYISFNIITFNGISDITLLYDYDRERGEKKEMFFRSSNFTITHFIFDISHWTPTHGIMMPVHIIRVTLCETSEEIVSVSGEFLWLNEMQCHL